MIEKVIGTLAGVAEPVSQVLIHSLWQGGLIALILTVALVLLKGRDARIRYLLSCLAMLTMVMMTIITGLYVASEASAAGPVTPEKNAMAATSGMYAETAVSVPADSDPAATAGKWLWNPGRLIGWFFPIWLTGILFLSARHILAWRRVRALTGYGTADIGDEWRRRFGRLCRDMTISRPVRLVGSSLAGVPCVIGWVKPVVLVPISVLAGLSTPELEMILAHELAHIRRYDILVNYIQTAVETLFFFNPAAWWISRRIRIEREHCCDDLTVAGFGNRLGYARALTNLEQLRHSTISLAAAADGSPLLHRVRRLTGRANAKSHLSGLGVAGVLLLATMLIFGPASIGGMASAEIDSGTYIEAPEQFEPDRDDIEGRWEISSKRGRARLTVKFDRDWESSFTVMPDELLGEIDLSTGAFQMRRDAGTFHFDGEFEQDDDELYGDGTCYFRADLDYVDHLQDLGFRLRVPKDALKLAMHNVSLAFVDGLHDAGYDDINLDQLIKMHIHDVTPEFVEELDELGYRNLSVDKLVKMQIHDAEPEFIRELAELGYRKLSVEQLVKMKIHDVEPDYIERLTKFGYSDIDVEQLVAMQIHDVDLDFIEGLRELGYRNLSPERLVEMCIHDVKLSFVRGLAEMGYKEVRPSKLVELCIHDVTVRYIRQLAELGYDELTLSELVKMRIHDVTPSYVRKLHRRGMDDLSARELIDYKIHGR